MSSPLYYGLFSENQGNCEPETERGGATEKRGKMDSNRIAKGENVIFGTPGRRLRLRGVLHHPGTEKPAVVVGCHGLFSDGNSPKQIALAQKLNGLGIAFLRFHHRGCGASEGDFSEVTSLEGRVRDLTAAVGMLRERADIGDTVGLFGSSMGGAVCLSAAPDLDVSAVVAVAAPVRIVSDDAAMKAIERSGTAVDPAFYRRRLTFDLSGRLSRLHHILVFHGEADDIIPVANAREILRNARDPKRLILQKGGDHRISDPRHQEEFMREAVRWFDRYLPKTGR